MIPRIAKAGRSFKGAAQYYLHDKKADTSERVAFVQTINLPTQDAKRAVAHMIDTATHAAELKEQAGLKSGRKLQNPVYAYSLAWHPDQAPSQAEQIEAARETLTALGLSDRQALIVSHNDTDHPHVHVIVNRVCPETGRAAVTSNDQLILSQWAEEYERKQGKILCEARVQNNAERDQKKWKKADSEPKQSAYEWKKQTTSQLWQEYRAERDGAKESRKSQYEALWKQREDRMTTRRAEIKQLFKPQWRDLFKQQRKELGRFDAWMVERLRYAVSQKEMNKGKAVLLSIFSANTDLRIQFEREQAQERQSLSSRQKQTIKDAGREVTKAWKYDRDQLRAMHKAEDDRRLEHYQEATDAVWNKDRGNSIANEFDQAHEAPKRTQRDMVKDTLRQKRDRSKGRTRRRPR